MAKPERISVLIPAFNEQGSIATDQYAAAPRFQKRMNINRAMYNDMPEVMQYYGGPERDRYLRNKGLSRNTDNTLGEQSWFVGQAENDLYLETFKQSMKELYTAQKAAAGGSHARGPARGGAYSRKRSTCVRCARASVSSTD